MMPLARSFRIRRALLLATGQTTSYGSGSGVDDGALMIGELHRYVVLTTGQYAGTVNIVLNGKTDVHSNACVFDEATGLMWSRTLSASVGPTSNGLLPWTTNGSGEGIFPFAAAANAALLAGHTNWRVPNLLQLLSILDYEATNAMPNATAFPSFPSIFMFTSTTAPNAITFALQVSSVSGQVSGLLKTSTLQILLVRGPV